MPNALEPAVIRERPARELHVERDLYGTAGYRELVPKRLAGAKLVTSLVRQAGQRLARAETTVAMALTRPEEAHGALSWQLADYKRVVGASQSPMALLDLALETSGDLVLGAVGETRAPHRSAHQALARSLSTLNRRYETELAELVVADDGRSEGAGYKRLVVEEKPGKAHVLAVDDASSKQSHKKWQSVARGGESTSLAGNDLVEGWAAVAITLRGAAAPTARRLMVAAVDLRFPTATLELDHVASLFDHAERWLAAASGQPLARFRAVSLNVPSAAVFGYARRELLTRHPRLALARFDATPFALGWHPTRTLLESLARRDAPFLWINTGEFPVVQLVGAWT